MDITQTSDGYLWLGSTQGLYRFDGVEFENFESSGQPLQSTSVYSLLSCRNGDLWVGFRESGVSLVRSGTVRNYTLADGLPNGGVSSLAQDGRGTIWAATQSGLARFDGKDWRKVASEFGITGVPISLYVDHQGTIWAATAATIFFLPQGESKFHATALSTAWVSDIAESPGHKMWMAETAGDGVRTMPLSDIDGKINHTTIAFGSRKVIFDRKGDLWITTLGDGLRRARYPDHLINEKIDRTSGQIESLTVKEGLSADYATSIYQDREGSVWVGTANGLDRFNEGAVIPAPVPGKFSQTVMAPGNGGDVWVGCLSVDVGQVHDNKWVPGITPFTAFSAVADPHGGTWWATYSWGFRELNNHFTKFEFPRPYFHTGQPTQIALDPSGALWLSGAYGIFFRRNAKWTAINSPASLLGKKVTVSYADAKGRLWFGYNDNSILLIDGSRQQILSARQGLGVGSVKAIFVGAASAWIAGAKGLALFDGIRFRNISPIEGGTFGSISGVIELQDGSVWLNSYRGIVRLTPESVSKLKEGHGKADYSIFNADDGLLGATQQSLPYPTLTQARDGRLWFGTSTGPVWIDPKDLTTNKLPPPVVIRSLTAKGKRYSPLSSLNLPELTHDLEISYTALSLTVPERVRFRYKLDGLDDDWQNPGARRRAFYTNLAPGDYRFHVIASNNDGVWNTVGATIPFTIKPAWFQTTLFRAVCVSAVMFAIWMIYRFRLNGLERQFNFVLEVRVQERTRIARDLHDTLLQSFQALMLHLQAVDDQLPEGNAKQQLEKTLKRGDQAITEGRRAVYQLRSSSIDANDLVQAVRTMGSEMAKRDTIAFSLVAEGLQRELHPVVRDELYRITREALRNVVAHAKAQRVEVEIGFSERLLRLRIRDDGIGIPTEMLQQGRPGHYGLAGMRERAGQIGAKLTIWSGGGNGTEIDVSIVGSIAYRSSNNRLRFPWFQKQNRMTDDSSSFR